MRVYQYWLLREALETNDYACAPLGALEDKMFSGFGRITYFEDAGGKIRLLDKVILKKITHLGRSPDIEDAAVMGFNAPRVVLTQSLPHGPVRSSTRVLAAAP
jgi:hypothetical protein